MFTNLLAITAFSAQPAIGTSTLTSGRVWSLVAAALGLAGLAVGVWALTRSAGRTGARRKRATVALAAGLAAIVIGGVVVAAADGGPGTGYGIVGGYIDIVVGAVAAILGGLTLARARLGSGSRR
ncbi:DUF6223 family protein [Amycolatopsis sp. lyj-112]|uniref:DUF6223 family protein n=1 Tax=Amycolatopsis sp. lyj-112 TaxID=2789288 RepID=UPI0039792FC2